MPYNPSTGIYSLPAIYLAIPGTVIISAQHNTPLVDLQTANNYPRPIIAGGTGENSIPGVITAFKLLTYNPQSLSTSEQDQAISNIGLREVLRADRTYYVRSDGNDANNGLTNSPSGAFLTIQHGVDVATERLDCRGFNVAIQVTDGSFSAGAVIDEPLMDGYLYIRGNLVTPSNVVITTASSDIFSIRNGAIARIEGFKTVSGGGSHIVATEGGIAYFRTWDFGTAGAGNHVIAYNEGNIFITGGYHVSGGAALNLHSTEKAIIRNLTPISISTSGTPAFSNFFVGASNATAYMRDVTFTGSGATGQRFYVHKNGLIDTNNAGINYFPGSVAGQAINGGIYDLMQLGRAISFAQPGYVVNDNGLWLQWGFSTFNAENAVAFPATFPTNCFGVMATPAIAPPSNGAYFVQVSGIGNSGFTASGRQFSGGTVSTAGIAASWWAWGN